VLRIEPAARSRPFGLPSHDASAPSGAARSACPPGRPGRPSARRAAWVSRGCAWHEVSTFARESEDRERNPDFDTLRTMHRSTAYLSPSLRQDRTLPGCAVKALRARSVLACGCAPHAACGVSLTAPGAVRPCLRGERYTVSLQGETVLRSVHGGAGHQQPQHRGASSRPAPHPRTSGSGIDPKNTSARTPNLNYC